MNTAKTLLYQKILWRGSLSLWEPQEVMQTSCFALPITPPPPWKNPLPVCFMQHCKACQKSCIVLCCVLTHTHTHTHNQHLVLRGRLDEPRIQIGLKKYKCRNIFICRIHSSYGYSNFISIVMQQKYFIVSTLSSSGCSHVGSLSSDDDQKNVGLWHHRRYTSKYVTMQSFQLFSWAKQDQENIC